MLKNKGWLSLPAPILRITYESVTKWWVNKHAESRSKAKHMFSFSELYLSDICSRKNMYWELIIMFWEHDLRASRASMETRTSDKVQSSQGQCHKSDHLISSIEIVSIFLIHSDSFFLIHSDSFNQAFICLQFDQSLFISRFKLDLEFSMLSQTLKPHCIIHV